MSVHPRAAGKAWTAWVAALGIVFAMAASAPRAVAQTDTARPPAAGGDAATAQAEAAQSAPSPAVLPPGVVARVNGETITREELTDTLLKYYSARALDSMIQQRVIRQEARRLGIKASAKDIEQAETEFFASRNFRQGMPLAERRKQWNERLALRGLTEDDFRRELELEILLRKIADRRIAVSDEQVRAEYDRRYGEQLRLSHIVVDDEALAREIHKRLAAGGSFAEEARRHSKDRTAVDGGQRLVPLARGQTEKAYEDAAFALTTVGQTSAPVKTTQGWVILKLDERLAARDVKFKDVRDELRRQLCDAERRRLSPIILAELLKQAAIERADTPADAPQADN
ncbi:MAG: peptidylprolyl isomerase [Planctomycetes bacterium]|nr:peptidylprolyl isomerase [Planctomycetota bacterium]